MNFHFGLNYPFKEHKEAKSNISGLQFQCQLKHKQLCVCVAGQHLSAAATRRNVECHGTIYFVKLQYEMMHLATQFESSAGRRKGSQFLRTEISTMFDTPSINHIW